MADIERTRRISISLNIREVLEHVARTRRENTLIAAAASNSRIRRRVTIKFSPRRRLRSSGGGRLSENIALMFRTNLIFPSGKALAFPRSYDLYPGETIEGD